MCAAMLSGCGERRASSATASATPTPPVAPGYACDLPWPDRNGPTFDGHALAEHAQGLPTSWDESTGENVAWKVPLQGLGHSSPVVAEGRVWFTSATEDGHQQYIYGIDARSGEVLHHKLLFENPEPEPLGNVVNTYASPTCVLEAGAVYAHFGSYGTARLDAATGEVVWQRRDLPARHFRGPGSSPILAGELLVLTLDGIDQQYVTALNKNTGETIWRTDRSTDYGDLDENGNPHRDGDLRKAFGTPALMHVRGRQQLISVGSRAAFGYDLETGAQIWTVTHDDFNAAARPLIVGNLVVINTGGRGAQLLAVRVDETTCGDVTQTHVPWNRERNNAQLSSPVLAGGRLYTVTSTGVLFAIDPQTGEELAALRLSNNYTSNPVVAGGLLYFFSEDGETSVVEPSLDPEVVSQGQLAEGVMATPSVAYGAIYLRTTSHLYKVAQP